MNLHAFTPEAREHGRVSRGQARIAVALARSGHDTKG
jgi:hypothetical protein